MKVYDSIMKGLNEALDFVEGNAEAKVHKVKIEPAGVLSVTIDHEKSENCEIHNRSDA